MLSRLPAFTVFIAASVLLAALHGDEHPQSGLKSLATDQPPGAAGNARHLKYFGFVGIDCGVDDPGDEEHKTNYIDEVQGFTNVAHLCVPAPDTPLEERIQAFAKAGLLAIIDVQGILFDRRADRSTGSGTRFSLRDDARARWEEFVRRNRSTLRPERIAAIYVVDEPAWNGLSEDEFQRSLQIIKGSRLSVPTFTVEAYAALQRIMVPDELDWIGFDRYDTLDPATDPAWQADLTTVKKARTRVEQRIVIVASTQWLPYYEKDAGVRPADLEKIIRSYYRVADSHPEVIALLGYVWPGGLDDPRQLGARQLPENVQKELKRIGQAIMGKE
jgi:hypothetical protein